MSLTTATTHLVKSQARTAKELAKVTTRKNIVDKSVATLQQEQADLESLAANLQKHMDKIEAALKSIGASDTPESPIESSSEVELKMLEKKDRL